MADFTVFTDAEGSNDVYTDGSTHSFDEHGHLVVSRPDGARVVYSSSGWTRLEEPGHSGSAKHI